MADLPRCAKRIGTCPNDNFELWENARYWWTVPRPTNIHGPTEKYSKNECVLMVQNGRMHPAYTDDRKDILYTRAKFMERGFKEAT